ELDYFECPAGRQLIQLAADPHRGVIAYRAPAADCNHCTLKFNCTDSDDGRTIERRLDSWIDSELRRFHRGISLTLFLLAAVLLIAAGLRCPERHDRAALTVLLLPLALGLWRRLPSLNAAAMYLNRGISSHPPRVIETPEPKSRIRCEGL